MKNRRCATSLKKKNGCFLVCGNAIRWLSIAVFASAKPDMQHLRESENESGFGQLEEGSEQETLERLPYNRFILRSVWIGECWRAVAGSFR